MKKGGCLIVLALILGTLGILALIGFAAGNAPKDEPHRAVASTCDKASSLHNQAVSDLKAGRYQVAYDKANAGLARLSGCDDAFVIKGYLLSTKGFAEHYLPQGDSRTDLNLANQLLQECQTEFYGTDESAACETEERNNIHTQTVWDMGQ